MKLPAGKKKKQNHSEAKLNFTLVYNKAIYLLSYRPRSEKELRIRLLQFANKKGLGDHQKVVEYVLSVLFKEGKINDLKFAKWWIEQRVEFKPRGKKLLRQELSKKGIDEKIITEAIEHFWQEEMDEFGVKREAASDVSLAEKAGKRKLKSLKGVSVSEFKQRMINYLLRRGFDYETCRKIIEKLKREKP